MRDQRLRTPSDQPVVRHRQSHVSVGQLIDRNYGSPVHERAVRHMNVAYIYLSVDADPDKPEGLRQVRAYREQLGTTNPTPIIASACLVPTRQPSGIYRGGELK